MAHRQDLEVDHCAWPQIDQGNFAHAVSGEEKQRMNMNDVPPLGSLWLRVG